MSPKKFNGFSSTFQDIFKNIHGSFVVDVVRKGQQVYKGALARITEINSKIPRV